MRNWSFIRKIDAKFSVQIIKPDYNEKRYNLVIIRARHGEFNKCLSYLWKSISKKGPIKHI